MSEFEAFEDSLVDLLDAAQDEVDPTDGEDRQGTTDLDDNDSESITRNVQVIKVSTLSAKERRQMVLRSQNVAFADRQEASNEIGINRQSGVINSFQLLFAKMDAASIERHFDSIRNWLDIELGLDWKTTVLRTVERLEHKGVNSITAERRVLLGMASIVADCSPEELETLQNGVKLHKQLQKLLNGASDSALN